MSEFLLEQYKASEKTAREHSQKLLLEGLYSYKTEREANFVQIRVYNMFMLLRYLDNEKRDETTSKGSNLDGASDIIVQVEEYLFIPAIKLILNEQNPLKPFLLFKYQTKKFEIYSVQNQGEISNLWDSLRRRCILYVSPSKVPSSSNSIKLEVQRADKAEVKNLSRFIFDYLCFPELQKSLPKLNFLFETPNLAGIVFKSTEVEQTAKDALLMKALTLKDFLLGSLRQLEQIKKAGYWPKVLNLELYGVDKDRRIVFQDVAALVRQPPTQVSCLIDNLKEFMAEASLLSKSDLDLLHKLNTAQQSELGIPSLIAQI